METKGVIKPCHHRLYTFRVEFLSLFVFLPKCLSLNVNIDYSFALPDEFGTATFESADCCPYGVMPDSFTNGLKRPEVIGIGVQKGGSTALFSFLNSFPLLHAGAKEMHYFERFNVSTSSFKSYLGRWDENRAIRRAQLADGSSNDTEPVLPDGGKLFEVSPSYILIPFAACRIKRLVPYAKFIVVLREPAERAHSALNHALNYNQKLPDETRPEWSKHTFLEVAQGGMDRITNDPSCNFLSGRGDKTYNDCFKCVMFLGPLRPECDRQTFVEATDNHLGFRCTYIGKNIIMRGFYAAQLAWWFTLFQPNQFKIVNSEDLYKNSLEVVNDIIDFLGFDEPYTEEMLIQSTRKNTGRYNDTVALQAEHAKGILREFYRRPNLELYRLLNEAGHSPFTTFEPYLRKLDYINCKDPVNIKTQLCGTSPDQVPDTKIEPEKETVEAESMEKEKPRIRVYRQLQPLDRQLFPTIPRHTIHAISTVILVSTSIYSLWILRSLR